MAVLDQKITDQYAIYLGDSCEVSEKIPNKSVGAIIYSPPFGGLYHYSSNERDLSNAGGIKEFFEHYDYIIEQETRIIMPGRMACVHCCDIPSGNSGTDYRIDFPGDIIKHFEKQGWKYCGRYCIWKEPFGVRLRTMAKNLAHKTIVEDSSKCSMAAADYLLLFRSKGENKKPIEHPTGLDNYAGSRKMPAGILKYRNFEGNQIYNKYSQWIWRQYASAFWYDIRLDRVLPYREARDSEDEKHVHPLQLDVIERAVVLWSNPGETIFTPFMGVGSEVYGALINGRKGVGIELKPTYYNQSIKNIQHAIDYGRQGEQLDLLASQNKTTSSDIFDQDDEEMEIAKNE